MRGLGQGERDHKFYVLLWKTGVQVIGGPYGTMNLAKMFFEDKCEELSAPELERLFNMANQNTQGMSPAEIHECAQAGMQYFRISRADDELNQRLDAENEEFKERVARLPEAEQKATWDGLLRDVQNRAREMAAQDAQFDGTENEP